MALFYLMEIQKGPAWSRTACTGRRWVFSPEVKSDPLKQESRARWSHEGKAVASLGCKRGTGHFLWISRLHLTSASLSALLDPW